MYFKKLKDHNMLRTRWKDTQKTDYALVSSHIAIPGKVPPAQATSKRGGVDEVLTWSSQTS